MDDRSRVRLVWLAVRGRGAERDEKLAGLLLPELADLQPQVAELFVTAITPDEIEIVFCVEEPVDDSQLMDHARQLRRLFRELVPAVELRFAVDWHRHRGFTVTVESDLDGSYNLHRHHLCRSRPVQRKRLGRSRRRSRRSTLRSSTVRTASGSSTSGHASTTRPGA
jgi:hypothetical protein